MQTTAMTSLTQKPIYVYLHDDKRVGFTQYLTSLGVSFLCAKTHDEIMTAVAKDTVGGIIITSSFMIAPEGQRLMNMIRHRIPSITIIERSSYHDRLDNLFVDLPFHDYTSETRHSYEGFNQTMERTGMMKVESD